MAIKGTLHSPKLQHYWLFWVISRTLVGGGLPLYRGAVGVFYGPSRLGTGHVLSMRGSTSLLVDDILLPRCIKWSINFRGWLFNERVASWLKHISCFIWVHIETSASYCMLQAILQRFGLSRCICKKWLIPSKLEILYSLSTQNKTTSFFSEEKFWCLVRMKNGWWKLFLLMMNRL